MVLYALLPIFLAAVAASQLAWWCARRYFPSTKVCAFVHRRLPAWRDKAQELLCAVPPQLDVSGFFAAVVWLPVVAMNMVLLAQVLETVVNDETRLEIPYVGSYAILALFMAVLFALIQAALAVFLDRAGSRLGRVFLAVGLVMAVAIECALSVYRAWLIRGGALTASGSVVDSLIGSAGIAFTGAFGVAVPVGECMLGAVAYCRFFEPGLRYALRVAAGLSLHAWSAVTWALFGWHPVVPAGGWRWFDIVRRALRDLRAVKSDVLGQLAIVNDSRVALSSQGRDLRRARSLSELTAESARLAAEVTAARAAWPLTHESLLVELLRAGDILSLSRSERQVSDAASAADLAVGSVVDRVGRAQKELKPHADLSGKIDALCRRIDNGGQQVSDLEHAAGLMAATGEALSRLIEDLKAALRGDALPHGALPAAQAAQIRELMERASSHPDPLEREFASIARENQVAAIAEAEQALREQISAEAKARHAAEEFRQVADAMKLPDTAAPSDPLQLRDELTTAERGAIALHERQRQDLAALNRKIDQKKYALSGRPRWLWVLCHPFGPYDPRAGVFLEAARVEAPAPAPFVPARVDVPLGSAAGDREVLR
jgi:hypothetical protein